MTVLIENENMSKYNHLVFVEFLRDEAVLIVFLCVRGQVGQETAECHREFGHVFWQFQCFRQQIFLFMLHCPSLGLIVFQLFLERL